MKIDFNSKMQVFPNEKDILFFGSKKDSNNLTFDQLMVSHNKLAEQGKEMLSMLKTLYTLLYERHLYETANKVKELIAKTELQTKPNK